jgi:hypothetical protein
MGCIRRFGRSPLHSVRGLVLVLVLDLLGLLRHDESRFSRDNFDSLTAKVDIKLLEHEQEHEHGFLISEFRLIRVTIRIGFVPLPCAFNNLAHVRELGYPAKFLANLVAGCNKHGGIAGTARSSV